MNTLAHVIIIVMLFLLLYLIKAYHGELLEKLSK